MSLLSSLLKGPKSTLLIVLDLIKNQFGGNFKPGRTECINRGLREPFKGKHSDFNCEGSKFRMQFTEKSDAGLSENLNRGLREPSKSKQLGFLKGRKAMLACGLMPTGLTSAQSSAFAVKEN